MYGKASKEGFGVLLTQDNIEAYLQQRQQDYETLRAEYESTGTVALLPKEDASYIADGGRN